MTHSTFLGTDRPSSNGAADVQPRHVFAVHVARPDPIQVSEMDSTAMSKSPTPMTPAGCDLRNFREMPIDVPRLLRSDLAHDESPEACWSAVLLWCVSWHEVPAGSLPDNDEWLAKRTGYWHKGKLDETWNSVRDGALHGWVKCSDGRLYHPVVAEKVNHAWHAKHRHAHAKLCERLRKRNRGRQENHMLPLEIPELDPWVARGCPLESELFPEEFGSASGGNGQSSAGITDDALDGSAGIPPENSLKGEGIERRGEELINTKPLSGEPDDAAFVDEADSESGGVDAGHGASGDVSDVVAYLNTKTGKAFRTVAANAKLIRARLAEGATVDQVKAVIDAKVAEWRDDREMSKYLRPSTLFNATRFEQYLGQLGDIGTPASSGDGAEASSTWWVSAGFASEWEARNDYCVPGNAHLWRDRRPVQKLPGVYVEPWPEGGV